jgi:hypothetical protein
MAPIEVVLQRDPWMPTEFVRRGGGALPRRFARGGRQEVLTQPRRVRVRGGIASVGRGYDHLRRYAAMATAEAVRCSSVLRTLKHGETVMTNETRELTAEELELVSGGSEDGGAIGSGVGKDGGYLGSGGGRDGGGTIGSGT